jgi:anaerobic selenocysteine-containing dehydrogenase
MNYGEAEELGGKDNDMVRLTLADKIIEVKLKIDNSIPAGILGLSTGLPGMPYLELPGMGKLTVLKS